MNHNEQNRHTSLIVISVIPGTAPVKCVDNYPETLASYEKSFNIAIVLQPGVVWIVLWSEYHLQTRSSSVKVVIVCSGVSSGKKDY